MYRWNQFHKKR